MRFRKLFKIVFGLLILFVVAVGLAAINNPILFKWVTGSAKHHGTSMPATVYTNGKVNNKIKIFYTDEAKNYLLSFKEYDSSGMLKFLNIDLKGEQIGLPVASSINDYEIIAGHLFQRETSGHFTSFKDTLKGFKFDPQLSFTGKQIKFNMPPNTLNFDSIRIILP